jgi:hypothetical protein
VAIIVTIESNLVTNKRKVTNLMNISYYYKQIVTNIKINSSGRVLPHLRGGNLDRGRGAEREDGLSDGNVAQSRMR